ncbi:MAG: Mobile element protein, partial [Gemmatimonadetes bacterium]|nr:Mobile element protein [Gemmatimonadota bacterium]
SRSSGSTRSSPPGESRGVNPFDYLADVLARVQDHPANALDELLPGAWAAAN